MERNMILWHRHHLIPRHAGGTDDPSNIIKVNVAMHAFLHNQLYKKYGNEYDRLAAAGLKGQINDSELRLKVFQENGRRHAARLYTKFAKQNGLNAVKSGQLARARVNADVARRKEYIVTHPCGKEEIVKDLPKFANKYNLSRSNLHKVLVGTRTHHKHFKIKYNVI